MSEKAAPTRDLKQWTFEQGNRLAREAETGSIDNVNRELSQVRSQLSPREYNALISGIQSANTARVAQDQYDLQGKQVKKLTVPTLILEDSPHDKDKLPDHVAGRVLADGKKESFEAPKTPATPAKRVGDDGNYYFPWSAAMGAKAFDDVLNPPERRK
jgi:hypothetical protein